MNRQEIKIAIVTLALIAFAAFYLGQRKKVLGKPGLVLESQSLTNEHGLKVADHRVAIPTGVPGFSDELGYIAEKEVEVLPKDTTFGRRIYQADDNLRVQVSAILMGTDRTSIHKPYYCITGAGWRIEKAEVTSIPMARPEPYQLQAQLLTTSQNFKAPGGGIVPVKGMFMYWYVSEDQLTPNHKEQMWFLARDLLTSGVLKRWAYVTFFSTCAPGHEQVRLQQMKRLAAEIVPAFQIPPIKEPRQTALLDTAMPIE
jgi:hypothetical protein